jgi:RimJ/RimL family protein N-acetyltransferase
MQTLAQLNTIIEETQIKENLESPHLVLEKYPDLSGAYSVCKAFSTGMRLPDEIVSERVILVALTMDHAEEMFNIVDNERERLVQTEPHWNKIQTFEDEAASLQNIEDARDKGTSFSFGITMPEEDGTRKIIGGCIVHTISREHQRCEIGYWIGAEYEGHGFTTESVAALEKACFNVGFHRIEMLSRSENKRSILLPKRLGYELEGRKRDAWIINGVRQDELIYAKLRPTTHKG